MENVQERKLGAGIITMSVIHFVVYFFAIAGVAFSLFAKDFIQEQAALQGLDSSVINPTQMVITLVLSIAMVIAVILILCKKVIGVYGYFTITAISIINSIITAGFHLSIISSLILPALMAFFIYKKKYVFGFKAKEEDLV